MGLSKRQASCPKSKVAYRMVCEDRVTGLQKRLSFRATSYPYGGGTLHHYRASFADFVSNTCHQQKSINPETVIRRAEALDLSEQERVGRLVDRLENMKRNCVSAGNLSGSADTSHSRYSCALCGEKFTVLGAGPAICKDCRKHICQKCGIEATMVSCGSQIGFAQNSQRPRLFLCRICSETREMWKKSGAWFFKGLPKYVLPDKKLERGRPRRTSRASSWAVVNNLRSLESLEPDSSSDEDAGRRLAMSRSLGTHEASSPTPTLAEEKNNRSSTPVFGPRGDAYSRQNSGNAGDYSNGLRSASATDVGQSQFSSTASVQPLPSPRGSGHGMQGRNSGQGFQSQFMNEHRQTSSDQLNSNQVHSFRKDSIESSSSQGLMMLDQNQSHSLLHYHEMDPEILVVNNEGPINNQNHSEALQQIVRGLAGDGYGTLEVSLLYDPAAQYLQCRVQRARGLRPMDIHGLTDSFCKLNILPIAIGSPSQRLRTKTVHKTRDPEYNEMVTFYGITETDMKNGRALHILVLQDDRAGKDFLGEAKLPLCQLQPYRMIHYNVYLENHCQVDHEEEVWGEDLSPRGQILVTLSYSTRRRALLVNILRAANLPAMDSNGFSDPFVKLYLIKRPEDNSQQTSGSFSNVQYNKKKESRKPTSAIYNTGIKWKTLNPEWNEEFAFETRLTDLTSQMLCLSVWDKDLGKSNDYLGGLILSCSSKGERLRHWIDAIKFPDHRHQAWHSLQEDPIPTE
ncbi:rabphilin-3A isoform X3 [Neodiprion fabricii]|uniref:rabphilin-3A isoform X3 n=1 Tax=Neodiprion fabricii TaxID=2872261 RepID=UPI001ED8F2EF|nr:rabphilin-3A isoform X3 [Neodiprion fabricii]